MREDTMSEMDVQAKLLIEACRSGLSAEVNRILSDVACKTGEVLDELVGILDSEEFSEVEKKASELASFWLDIELALQNKADCEIWFGLSQEYGEGPNDE
jgi:hypothetical protein